MSRRFFRFSFLRFLCIFCLFWMVFLLYLSTWNPSFFKVVNKKFEIDVKQMIRGDFVELIEKDLKTDQDEDVIFKEIQTDFENQEMKQLEEEIQAEIESYEEKPETIPKPTLSNEILQLHARLNLTDPGHLGTGVELPQILDFDIEEKLNNSYRTYQINEFVSSLVPLDRELLDIRSDYCKQMNYSQSLPMASIILVLHNEGI